MVSGDNIQILSQTCDHTDALIPADTISVISSQEYISQLQTVPFNPSLNVIANFIALFFFSKGNFLVRINDFIWAGNK